MLGFGGVCAESVFDFSLDIRARPATVPDRRGGECRGMISSQAGRRRRRHSGERALRVAITKQTNGNLIPLKVQQLFRAEPWRELTIYAAGVVLTALEHHARPVVGRH